MILPKKNVPRWIIIVIDLFISAFALFFAYLIRFDLSADLDLWKKEWEILSSSLLVYFGVRFVVFYLFGIHRGIIRHTSTADFRRLFIAITVCSGIYLLFSFLRHSFYDGYYLFPRTIFVLEYILCLFFFVSSRFTIKLLYLESMKNKGESVRIAIYGAGISGIITKRSLEKDQRMNYEIIGFFDDDAKLFGSRIEGETVFPTSKLAEVHKKEKIDQIIVAIQKPDADNVRLIVNTCLELNIAVKKVPSLKNWVNGEFSTNQISKVNIDDLLGRKPIVLNQENISNELKDQVVLVTGGAGSIGSGLIRQILSYEPKRLILLDQAESPAYELEQELKGTENFERLEVVIGDIRNFERMKKLFELLKPNWVFHAAAYKHVPLMEDNPSEAIRTNIFGTNNLVDLSIQFNVHKFVMVSTDKAVNPTNVMGASKRIAEMIAQKTNQIGKTQFITTRFGNVLGSNGSVIPLFKKQIEQGGPITVTDERITRFFMTIPEACQLVLEAGVMGKGGEIFVFDMGDSVKIVDLAKNMIRLSGLELGKDIEIVFTGLRPGEKLYEELLNDAEKTIATHHPKIMKAMEREGESSLYNQIDDLIKHVNCESNHELVKRMKQIVPEFISNNSTFSELDKD
ncbi:MAG: polysaccharide biosynthesis protein [Fluviicola sp.]